MQILPNEIWGEVGMSLSFLGRKTYRPANANVPNVLISENCK